MRPWMWCPDEKCWLRTANNHAIVARIRPPQEDRSKANATVYLHDRALGMNAGSVQECAEWCDQQLVSTAYRLDLENDRMTREVVYEGLSWVWLRVNSNRR